jgi:adenylylsulfate kinase
MERMTQGTGFAVWLTGLPAAGKTTLAEGLAEALRARGLIVQILDSDDLRDVLTPEPTYSAEERAWFYRVVAFIAQLLTQNGVDVIIAATANRQQYRDYAREAIEHFAEIYVHCPLQTCIDRDEKGIYDKALSGEASTVPGLQVPYEPPENPIAVVNAEATSPQEGVQRIVARLKERSFLQSAANQP